MSSQPVLLFVDDEPAILSALRRALRKEDFDIRTAQTAEAAFEVLASEPVALVVADLHMPGIGGIELLGSVAEQYPDAGRILMSGNADLPSLVEAVNRGQLTYYFEKPWSDDSLRLALRELVENIGLQKKNRELIETVRQQNETLIRQSEIQHRFFATMSHEIRTPLNGIFGMLQVLHEQISSPEDRKLVETALASSEHLAEIVNDVLDFSKIEAGEFELSRKPFDITRLIVDLIASLKPLAEDKGLKLRLIGSLRADLFLLGDDLRLRQVLINLIGNGIKFTSTGTVTLKVSQCQPGKQVLEVVDTGIGIAEENQSKLFEAYHQVSSRGTASEEGSGLGLSIAKRLINLMDGDITVQSEVGTGTTFIISLALPQAEKPAESTHKSTVSIDLEGRQYLVVDDNPTNRMIVKAMLSQVGAEVAEADSGEACISLLRQGGSFDLVFMDISMDGMDGIETLQKIRGEKLIADDVPVIAMSAHVQPEEQARFLSSGMTDFLGKPFNRESLLELLSRYQAPTVETLAGESATAIEIARPEPKSEPEVELMSVTTLMELGDSVGSEAMRAMVTSFVSDMLARAEKIQEAEKAEDWAKVAAEAHALGSSAGMFGAMRLHGHCRSLETLHKAENLKDMPAQAQQLLDAVRPSITAVSAIAESSF